MASSKLMDTFTALQVINLDDDEREAYSERIAEYFGERSKEDCSSDDSDEGELFLVV